jgi:hypothetical protein
VDRTVISMEGLPLEQAQFAQLLKNMAGKRFKSEYTITAVPNGVAVVGEPAVRDWAKGVADALRGK